jgi:hypothetical protein
VTRSDPGLRLMAVGIPWRLNEAPAGPCFSRRGRGRRRAGLCAMVNACTRLIAAHPAKGVEADETTASPAVGMLINAHTADGIRLGARA